MALSYDHDLEAIAKSHSVDMGQHNFFKHKNLDGLSASDRASAAGYTCYKEYGSYYTYGVGENIIWRTLYSSYRTRNDVIVSKDYYSVKALAWEFIQWWMDSPGHRENILTASYDKEGIGVFVTWDEKVYATQNFC